MGFHECSRCLVFCVGQEILDMPNQYLRADGTFKMAKRIGIYKAKSAFVHACRPNCMSLLGSGEVIITGIRVGAVDAVRFGCYEAIVRHKTDTTLTVFLPEPVDSAGHPDPRPESVVDVITVSTRTGAGGSAVRFIFTDDQKLHRDDNKSDEKSARQQQQIVFDHLDEELETNEKDYRGNKHFVALRAVVRTVMNEDGLIVASDIVPDEKWKHTGKVLAQGLGFRVRV